MSQRIPSVEDQLFIAQRALALGVLTMRAVAHGGDLCLSHETEEEAYSLLANTFEEGLKACRAATAIIPAEVINLAAPEVK